jgi:DNA-binding transcriptional ArsR family regulator
VHYEPGIVAVAAAVASPARLAMLLSLLDGHAHSLTDLALEAGVTVSTASSHLRDLVEAGLVDATRSGRRRDFTLHGPQAAELIELLGEIAPTPQSRARPIAAPDHLRAGRTCYDHLAGRLGVSITEALVRLQALRPGDDGYELSAASDEVFARFDVSVTEARRRRRGLAVACLDWTERRHHLGGALGAALCDRFMAAGWIRRSSYGRAVSLTAPGERALHSLLGPDWAKD